MCVGLVKVQAISVVFLNVNEVKRLLRSEALGSGPGNFAVSNSQAFVFVVGCAVFILAVNVGEVKLPADVCKFKERSLGSRGRVVGEVHWDRNVVEEFVVRDHLRIGIAKRVNCSICLQSYKGSHGICLGDSAFVVHIDKTISLVLSAVIVSIKLL